MSKTITPKPEKVENKSPKDYNHLFKKIFFGSLLLMLGILWISGYDTGFNSDEMDMNIYGKANIAYYTSGGKDTTFLHPDHHDGVSLPQTLPYYGSGFEYFASGITSLIGDHYEYNTRHILNQFIAVLGLLFTGLIARKIKDYKTAILSIWLLFLTPIFSGLAIFDTKDIPFLSAYIACIYFSIVFFENLPKPNWKILLGLGFSIWFLLSIRIGGILIIGFIGLYAFLQYWKDKTILKSIKNWGSRLALSIGAAFVLMILFWPFVLRNPGENIIKTLNVLKAFPQKIVLAFDGTFIDSLTLPANYLPKMFSITIPLAILLTLLAGFIGVLLFWKKLSHRNALLLLLISGLFPVFYAIYTHMSLYNSWRHLLFIYPSVIIFCSVGFIALLDFLEKPLFQLITLGIIALGLISPIKWSVENSPYQYAYYNELAGGFNKAYYEYDTDYWQISVKEAVDWLMKNEPVREAKDTLVVATNAYTFTNYYLKKRYPGVKIKADRLGEKSNFGASGTYTIFNSLFLEPQYLENCFPSPYSIHTVNIDNMPVSYVAKDTSKYLFKGYTAFQAANYNLADSFLDLYLKEIKFNDNSPKNLGPVFGMIAFTKLAVNKRELSFRYADLCLKTYPSEYASNITMGILLFDAKDYKRARNYLMIARELKPEETGAQQYLDMIPKGM